MKAVLLQAFDVPKKAWTQIYQTRITKGE